MIGIMQFEIKEEIHQTVVVLGLHGYFSDESGKILLAKIRPLLQEKRMRFVIDFTDCSSINSPGAAKLMEIVLLIVEDFRGAVVITGLKPLAASLLSMVGVIPPAEAAATVPEAIAKLTGGAA